MFPNNFNQLYGCSPFYTFAIQNFPFIEKDLDALTDYQLMCKIFKYLDDKIKEVDEKYAGIYEIVEKLEQDFIEFKDDVIKLINQYKQDILAQVDIKLEQQYNTILNLMNDYQRVINAYIDGQIALVNHRIDEIEIGAISIYNPLTGTLDPIQIVIDDLYNSLRYNAITCTEYDALELTATEYDALQITANNFDLNGKAILMPE